jgi:hypothetical protein
MNKNFLIILIAFFGIVGLAAVIKKSTVAPLINVPNITLNLPLTKNPIKILPGSGIYTPQEVWKHRNSLINKKITVRGQAESFAGICTKLGCPKENPCCNHCFGPLGFKIKDTEITVCYHSSGDCQTKDYERILRIYGKNPKRDYDLGDFYGTYKGEKVRCWGRGGVGFLYEVCDRSKHTCHPLENGKTYLVTGSLGKIIPGYHDYTYPKPKEELYLVIEDFQKVD